MQRLKFLNASLIVVIWLSLVGFAPRFAGMAAGASPIVTAAPGAFQKVSPKNGEANQPALGVTLTWTASAGATGYQYCVNNKPRCPGNNKKWQTAGSGTSITTGALSPNTVYYWQVRAMDASNGTTEADTGTWWRFKTQPGLGAFGKIAPANTLIDPQPVASLVLRWGASANATGYQYCLYPGTTNPCGTSNWITVGNITQVTVYRLQSDTVYHWQVRAVNGSGTLPADGGTFWQFKTIINAPSAFAKLSPQNGALNEPVNLHLTWSPSAGAEGYEYCITETNTICESGWTTVAGNVTSVSPFPVLHYDTPYYWQVRAYNTVNNIRQYTEANSAGDWWRFTTIVDMPGTFSKINPMDGAQNQLVDPWLYWMDSQDATAYAYCLLQDSTASCGDADWHNVGTATSVQLHGLTNHATYYWQVRASNISGPVYANNGTMWRFSTLYAPPTTSDQAFSIAEDTLLTGQITADADPNAHLTFKVYEGDPAGTLTFHDDGSFTYLPPQDYNGSMTFQFTVSDGYNAPVGPYTATITVTPVNDPPVITPLPDVTVLTGDVVSFTVTVTDPDLPYGNEVLTFQTPLGLPADATFDLASGDFIWEPIWSAGQSNQHTITFVVKDKSGATAEETVKITVNPMTVMLPILMNGR